MLAVHVTCQTWDPRRHAIYSLGNISRPENPHQYRTSGHGEKLRGREEYVSSLMASWREGDNEGRGGEPGRRWPANQPDSPSAYLLSPRYTSSGSNFALCATEGRKKASLGEGEGAI